MNLGGFVKILEDAGLGTAGKDIFLFELPADVPEGILIRLPLTGVKVHHEIPGYHTTEIQVIVRSQKQSVGHAKADRVMAALTSYHRIVTDPETGEEIEVKQMLPETLPIRYPRSDGNGIEWSINFKTALARS